MLRSRSRDEIVGTKATEVKNSINRNKRRCNPNKKSTSKPTFVYHLYPSSSSFHQLTSQLVKLINTHMCNNAHVWFQDVLISR